MNNLNDYMQDGANHQARAVLAFMQDFNVEESWDKEFHRYEDIKVARWENCREQGYVLSLNAKITNQLNIAFFEHRNSDQICAVRWVQCTLNSPTIETAEFGDIYQTKYDVSFRVGYGEIYKIATWICEQLTEFYCTINEIKPEHLEENYALI